jgi:hypothetical protein
VVNDQRQVTPDPHCLGDRGEEAALIGKVFEHQAHISPVHGSGTNPRQGRKNAADDRSHPSRLLEQSRVEVATDGASASLFDLGEDPACPATQVEIELARFRIQQTEKKWCDLFVVGRVIL